MTWIRIRIHFFPVWIQDPDPHQNCTGLNPVINKSHFVQKTFKSTRKFFGHNEEPYIMDAKSTGNIGRYLNHW